jgi:hypothetical protein
MLSTEYEISYMYSTEDITVVIPTSPIIRHPDTSVIEETIASVRAHLPNSEIIISVDGVREEQRKFTDRYTEYKKQLMWLALHHWDNVLPVVYDTHMHQANMMTDALKNYITTELILYVEHDAPLTPDLPIEWARCIKFIESGKANTIRFHFENVIPDVHEHLMLGQQGPFMRTYQWSQRPHLTTREYYKQIMSHFAPTANTMIEDLYHGVMESVYLDRGMDGWNEHKLWIYHPEGGIKRSYHIDARGSESKFNMRFK